ARAAPNESRRSSRRGRVARAPRRGPPHAVPRRRHRANRRRRGCADAGAADSSSAVLPFARTTGPDARARPLPFADRAAPVGPGVVVEDLLAQLGPRRAALLAVVPVRRRDLEPPELRQEVLLAVALRRARPNDVRPIAEHFLRELIERVLPRLELPVIRRTE